jgi:hypothetical protein
MSMYPIATATLSSAGTLQFVNIPQGYTNLQLRVTSYVNHSSTTTQSVSLGCYTNEGTLLSPYYFQYINGDGASLTAGAANGAAIGYGYGTTGTNVIYSSHIIDILDYSNTTKSKTVRCLGGYDANGSGNVFLWNLSYMSTLAVGQITFNYGGFSAGAGSRADLYGVYNSPMTGA